MLTNSSVSCKSHASSNVFAPSLEKQGPRISRVLPASVDVREIAYRIQRMVEAQERRSFIKFEALCYRTMVVSSHEEPSVEQRMARAVELSIGMRAQATSDLAPPGMLKPRHREYDYFSGLHSQQPCKRTITYFLKVDALWAGAFGHYHLRVQLMPPARQPLGVPSAIAPLSDSGLMLEGIIAARPETPLEPFAPTMSALHHEPHSHAARLARGIAAGMAFAR